MVETNPIEDNSQYPLMVWYDSKCPLCRREIALLKRLDTRQSIRFIDIHNSSSCPIDPALLLERLHAREQFGTLVSGAEAFAAMWRKIPVMRPFGLAAQWKPLLWLLERIYVGFLRIRPKLQTLASRLAR